MARGARNTAQTGTAPNGGTGTTMTPKRARTRRSSAKRNVINWTTPQFANALSAHVASSLNGFDTMPKGKDLVHAIGLSVQGFIGAQGARL